MNAIKYFPTLKVSNKLLLTFGERFNFQTNVGLH